MNRLCIRCFMKGRVELLRPVCRVCGCSSGLINSRCKPGKQAISGSGFNAVESQEAINPAVALSSLPEVAH